MSMLDQLHAANRLQEIYDAYWAGAYRDEEAIANLHEVMLLLGTFIKEN